jgi:hypothetical protein
MSGLMMPRRSFLAGLLRLAKGDAPMTAGTPLAGGGGGAMSGAMSGSCQSVGANGAVGDGVTDDTAAIQAAVAAAAAVNGLLCFEPLPYKTTASIVVPSNVTVRASGAEIIYFGNDTALEIRGRRPTNNIAFGRQHYLPAVRRGLDYSWCYPATGATRLDATSVGIKIVDCMYDTFFLSGINWFRRGLVLVADTFNCVCNEYHVGRIINTLIGIDMVQHTGDPVYGVNQNTFIGGAIRIDSAHTQPGMKYINMPSPETNGNTFVGVNLEDARGKSIYCASYGNMFLNCRFEGNRPGAVEFTKASGRNKVMGGGLIDANMVWDSGYGNTYDIGSKTMSRYYGLDADQALPFMAGSGAAAAKVQFGAYGDKLSVSGGYRHKGIVEQELFVWPPVPEKGVAYATPHVIARPASHIRLDSPVPLTIQRIAGSDATVSSRLTFFPANGNCTLLHSPDPEPFAGKFINKLRANRLLAAREPVSYIEDNGNWYQET